MVTELSFICFWQLQVYLLINARPFLYFLGAMNFYAVGFYGLGKIEKNGYFVKFQNFGVFFIIVPFTLFRTHT